MSSKQTNPNATFSTSVDKVAAFKSVYLVHGVVAQVEKDLDRLFDYGQVGGQIGTSASTYMLIGDSGSGKTAALRRFKAKHPKIEEPERDIHPVLYVEVPPCTTRKALAEEILRVLGAFIPAKSTEIRLTARVRDHLRDQGVKVLLLDEAQHLTDQERKRLNYDAADWVKGIANDGNCSVVLAGMPDAWEIYRYNVQLRRRSFGNRKLSAYRVSDGGEWRTFRGLLKHYDSILPFEESSNLTTELVALRIHQQVGGLTGKLSDFLAAALALAIDKGLQSLAPEVLHETAEQQSDLDEPNWVNPFDLERDELMAAALEREERPEVIGIDRPTNLRRGRRSLTQQAVLG